MKSSRSSRMSRQRAAETLATYNAWRSGKGRIGLMAFEETGLTPEAITAALRVAVATLRRESRIENRKSKMR